MPAGAFLGESFDAHLAGAGLRPAGQSGPVSFRLPTQRFARIVLRRLGVVCDWGGGHGVGVARLDADRDGTVAPAARLALGVRLRLRVGLSLGLRQASTLTERRADLAAALLADPPA